MRTIIPMPNRAIRSTPTPRLPSRTPWTNGPHLRVTYRLPTKPLRFERPSKEPTAEQRRLDLSG